MDFFKQAASFAQSKKTDESSGSTGGGGFGFNDVSDLMNRAEGFLGEKKPEVVAPEPEKKTVKEEEEEEVVKKPPEDTEEVLKPAVTKEEDTDEQVSEKPKPTTESSSAKPVKDEESAVPTTTTTTDAKPSYSELYGSAQTLFSGLRGKMEGKPDVDNQQIASAAEDLVQGAESLGLLKPDNPYGGYFKKAEGYLHDYGSSVSAPKKPSSDESA